MFYQFERALGTTLDCSRAHIIVQLEPLQETFQTQTWWEAEFPQCRESRISCPQLQIHSAAAVPRFYSRSYIWSRLRWPTRERPGVSTSISRLPRSILARMAPSAIQPVNFCQIIDAMMFQLNQQQNIDPGRLLPSVPKNWQTLRAASALRNYSNNRTHRSVWEILAILRGHLAALVRSHSTGWENIGLNNSNQTRQLLTLN